MVDDEPDERFLLRRAFERAGHEVTDAADGAAALAIVRESLPDLVVTDMRMPVMDGAELMFEPRRIAVNAIRAAICVQVDPIGVNRDQPVRMGSTNRCTFPGSCPSNPTALLRR